MSKIIFAFFGQNRFFSVFKEEVIKIKKQNNSNCKIFYQYEEGQLSEQEEKELKEYNVVLRKIKEVDEDILLKFDPMLKSRESSRLRKMGGGLRRATIWRQIIDVRSFLDFIKDDFSNKSYLIRLRTDYSMSENFYQKILKKPEDLFPDAPKSDVFIKKIWVMFASATNPFYLHDAVFGGTIEDLNKLIDSENNICLKDYYPTHTGLPTFLFIRPFIESTNIHNAMLILKKKPFEYSFLKDKKYRDALLEYYVELTKSFNIEYFESIWYLQWLKGNGVKRIWVPFNTKLSFCFLPYFLIHKRLMPIAFELNYTLNQMKKNISLLPRSNPLSSIFIDKFLYFFYKCIRKIITAGKK